MSFAAVDKKSVGDVWPIKNKRFLVYCDPLAFNQSFALVPLGTIRRLLNAKGRVIVATCFGASAGHPLSLSELHRADALSKFPSSSSAKSLVSRLVELLGPSVPVDFAPDSMTALQQIKQMAQGSVLVLENLNFYAAASSERADVRRDMARVLASYCDVFINDNFASVDKESACGTELPRLLKHGASGQLIQQELSYFNKYLSAVPRPVALITGSSRVEEKLKSLEQLIPKVDKVLVGSAIALPLLKAKGINTGKQRDTADSKWHDRLITEDGFAQRVLATAARHRVRLVLPVDFACATEANPSATHITQSANIPDDHYAVDIGPNTQALFAAELRDCRCVFWNGQLGAGDEYNSGTCAVAKAVCHTQAEIVVCGQSTLECIRATKVESSASHVSSSPAVALRILQGAPLPGIDVLSDAQPAVAAASTGKVVEALRASSLFHECTATELQSLATRAVQRSMATGDYLLREGDRVNSVYVVVSGHLVARSSSSNVAPAATGHRVPPQQHGTAMRTIHKGHCIGELDFLHGRVSQEEIVAGSNDVMLYQLTTASVADVLSESPDMAQRLVKSISEKLRLSMEQSVKHQHSVWCGIEHEASAMRKPIPTPEFSKTFSGRGVNTLSTLATTVLLWPLTQQLTPFTPEPGTVSVAHYGSGLALMLLHHFLRDVSFSNLNRSGACGSYVAAMASQTALVPLRLAALGLPLNKITSTLLVDTALTDGAMSLAPRVAHTLLRLSETPKERESMSSEILMAAVCRVVTVLLFMPIYARRLGAAVGARQVYLAMLRQLLSLLIELVAHRYFQRAGKYFAF